METQFKKIFIGLTAGFIAAPAFAADTLSFPEVWRSVSDSSVAQESARFSLDSARSREERTGRHWLPRLYLDAKSYRTNDPASAFMGVLEQRKLTAADFAPNSLNQPESQTFSRGALGLDLALYEGGSKLAEHEMASHEVSIATLSASQVQIEQYAQTSVAYGSLASIRAQKAKLLEMDAELIRMMKGYQLGQKSNPVGYSGLLGMKSLGNRIKGLLAQFDARERAAFGALKEMGVTSSIWSPQDIDAREFTDRYLNAVRSEDASSNKVQAAIEEVKVNEGAAKMERARSLPKLGTFAESQLFNGNRDSANAYVAGVYLQWNLFDPSVSGRHREATLAAKATEKLAEAKALQERSERSALRENQESLRTNLGLLDESEKLLSEQARMVATLFRSGSVPALQVVEVLNRRADLIEDRATAEQNLLQGAAELAAKTNFDVSRAIAQGGTK